MTYPIIYIWWFPIYIYVNIIYTLIPYYTSHIMVTASHELSHEISGGFRSNGSPSHPRGFFEKILLDSLDENWGTMLGNQKKNAAMNPLSAIKSPHSLPSGKLLHNELENHHFLAG